MWGCIIPSTTLTSLRGAIWAIEQGDLVFKFVVVYCCLASVSFHVEMR